MAKSLKELLGPIRTKVPHRGNNRDSIYDPYPVNPNTLEGDGVDHINISPYAKTELGKALANEVPLEVRHKVFGKFKSVTGFWYYIKSNERDDRCRKLIGKGLKDFTKGLTLSEVKNFRAIILDTVWMKICQYPAIREELLKSTLPFDCYFEDRRTGVRQRPNYFAWFLSGLNDLRAAVQGGYEPDIRKYLDDRNSEIYEFVLPKRAEEAASVADEPVELDVHDDEQNFAPAAEDVAEHEAVVNATM